MNDQDVEVLDEEQPTDDLVDCGSAKERTKGMLIGYFHDGGIGYTFA
jgi:hypothetical protein